MRKLRDSSELPHLGGFGLMPTPEGTCPECGCDHEPELPHNRDSLAYQYWFYGKNGRWPTWEDAMAHCEDHVKVLWSEAFEEELKAVKGD